MQTSGRGNRVAARTCGRLLNLVYICRYAQKNVQKSAVTHKIEWEIIQEGEAENDRMEIIARRRSGPYRQSDRRGLTVARRKLCASQGEADQRRPPSR